ncbi:MAG: ArsR family transcriptional regulator [Phycisphaerales bacterium]|nr:MAG: ArsR family transcriptional regulator [Phycisphaerales bacterium]
MNDSSRDIPIQSVPCCESLACEKACRLFKALADPNRAALLGRLVNCTRPCTVSEIACCLPIDLSVVSRHLRQLREADLLESEKCGKEVRYRVKRNEIVSALRGMADAIERGGA